MKLSGDYETFNTEPIKNSMFKYAESDTLDILCMSYKIDAAPTRIWYPGLDVRDLAYAMRECETFHAFNAGFEYLITHTRAARYYGLPEVPLAKMRDTALKAAVCALPRSLGQCAEVLGTPIQKDEEGKRVMLKLSQPRTPSKSNPSIRYTPQNAPEDFAKLYEYCINDTDTEEGIDQLLPELSPFMVQFWKLDYEINARGVPIDKPMVEHICMLRDEYIARLNTECRALTGYNTTHVAKLHALINEQLHFQHLAADERGRFKVQTLASMAAPNVSIAIQALRQGAARSENNALVLRVLELRQQAAKTSVKKFDRMLSAMCRDGRIRGMFLIHGAGTGRHAGRIVQFHNLAKPVIGTQVQDKKYPQLKGVNVPVLVAEQITHMSLDNVLQFFPRAMDVFSSVLRPAVLSPPGHRQIVVDYKSIEARIISWLANEEWRLEVFRTHGKIYEAAASRMFNIPIEDIGKDSKVRQSGKISELALSFQGAVAALIRMGAISQYGLKYEELLPLVKSWRKANSRITQMWAGLRELIIESVRSGRVLSGYRCHFGMEYHNAPGMPQFATFVIQLPSGRKLYYPFPRLRKNKVVWNDETGRYEIYDKNKHPLTAHERIIEVNFETRGDGSSLLDLTTPEGSSESEYVTYLHPGFEVQEKTEFVFRSQVKGTFWGWQSMHGGLAAENITQAVAADILQAGLVRTEAAGYQTILHVHDEGDALMRYGVGSVEEYKTLLCVLPPWAEGCPIDAEGIEVERYRK